MKKVLRVVGVAINYIKLKSNLEKNIIEMKRNKRKLGSHNLHM
jgi:hypothetical protein